MEKRFSGGGETSGVERRLSEIVVPGNSEDTRSKGDERVWV